MKSFEYIVQEELGLHARPAGILVKEAKKFQSSILISKNEKHALATQLMKLLQMNIKKGDLVTVTVEGQDEEEAAVQMQHCMEENL